MACIALRLAAKQVPSRLLVRGQDLLVGVGEGIVEFRRERAYIRRGFISRNGERKLVISRVRTAPVLRAQVNGQRVIRRWRPRPSANLVDVGWPFYRECLLAPDGLKEQPVGTLGEP